MAWLPGSSNGRGWRRIPPDVRDHVRRDAVLQRVAGHHDITSQVVAFCRAETVTGQTVVIDAGLF